VTTQGAYLRKEGETVVVRVEDTTRIQVPLHTLSGVVCFGQVMMSPQLMAACAEKDVFVSFLSEHGRFWARVQGAVSGNVLLRREQYRRADDEEQTAAIARAVVIAKGANSRTVLLRSARDRPESPGAEALREGGDTIAKLLDRLRLPQPLDSVRGIEGSVAREYFARFAHLVAVDDECFRFTGRSRRPPLDPLNALLSFVYTLLVHDVTGALEAVGLDPAVGYLHRDRPGRPGLALDLMEEFRPHIADRLVLSLINRRQAQPKGFTTSESGAVTMDDETRKTVLVEYQKRKQEEIRHPFIDETVAVGLLPHVQALLLARYLRGELDAYPAFVWK